MMPNQLGMNVNRCREDNGAVVRHQHQHHRLRHHIPEYADYVALIEKGYQQARGRRWCCCSLLQCYSGFAGSEAEMDINDKKGDVACCYDINNDGDDNEDVDVYKYC